MSDVLIRSNAVMRRDVIAESSVVNFSDNMLVDGIGFYSRERVYSVTCGRAAVYTHMHHDRSV